MSPSAFKLLLALLLALAIVGAIGSWSLPVDAVQSWAVSRAGSDPYAAYEAAGQAESLWWLGRVGFPALIVAIGAALRGAERLHPVLRGALQEFLDATRLPSRFRVLAGLQTITLRLLVAAWLVLACVHLVGSIEARTREWAIFRTRSGSEVLPNISFENKEVIRYLRDATPEDARILVLSDQALFFLAYYLLPRTVLHPLHPDAEFAIPQPGESRPAYRLHDLPEDDIERIRADYVLEYFQGPPGLDVVRLTEDADWVVHWRQQTRQTGTPPYLVVLRRAKDLSR